jgi:hypothetical protein
VENKTLPPFEPINRQQVVLQQRALGREFCNKNAPALVLQILDGQLHIRILPCGAEFGFRLLGVGLVSFRL